MDEPRTYAVTVGLANGSTRTEYVKARNGVLAAALGRRILQRDTGKRISSKYTYQSNNRIRLELAE